MEHKIGERPTSRKNCGQGVFFHKLYLLPEIASGAYFQETGIFYRTCAGLLAVDKTKKHLLGLTQSNILTWALISPPNLWVRARMRTAVSIFDFVIIIRWSLITGRGGGGYKTGK